MKILVVGDIHAKFEQFLEELNMLKPNMVISTGDFGFWPSKYDLQGIFESNQIPIYFCDGNHEDHEALLELCDESGENDMVEIAHNLYYMTRGSTLKLPDGQVVLFVGGARSIDRDCRLEGVNYFPEEELDFDVLDKLDCVSDVDIVISHTKPSGIDVGIDCDYDPSMEVLDEAFEMFHPSQWFFSHFHTYAKQNTDKCDFACLNQIDEPGWYEWINID